jgi:hypothetical protein
MQSVQSFETRKRSGPRAVSPTVQRYLDHAVAYGAAAPERVGLVMSGRIRVPFWTEFHAEQETGLRDFTWTAKAGPWRVADSFDGEHGITDARIAGLALMHSDDAASARSAAGRAALEAAAFAPGALAAAGEDVVWRTISDSHITATWTIGPERPTVHIRLGQDGAVHAVWVHRWRKDRYVPCGATIESERWFGDLRAPSRLTVSWGFGTHDERPFFEAEVLGLRGA